MKLTTKEKDDLTVHKYKEGKKELVELLVESDIRGALVFLTPKEAERLGNALIKVAELLPDQYEGEVGRCRVRGVR